MLFSPFFGMSVLALVYVVGDLVDHGFDAGHVVGIAFLGSMALLLGYQVIQSIRDLFATTVETVGIVERQWSRNEFMLFRNGYIFVKNNVFRVAPEEYPAIKLGDTVRVTHYPHTATVESIAVVEHGDAR